MTDRARLLSNRTRSSLKLFALQVVEEDRFALLRLAMFRMEVEVGDERTQAAWEFLSQAWQELKEDRENEIQS